MKPDYIKLLFSHFSPDSVSLKLRGLSPDKGSVPLPVRVPDDCGGCSMVVPGFRCVDSGMGSRVGVGIGFGWF